MEKTKTNMETEIFEQANVLENLFKTNVNEQNSILIDIPKEISKVVIVASGSSCHCAKYAANLFGEIADVDARAIYSSEFILRKRIPNDKNTLYIFITQSGETSDTNAALKIAKEAGLRTLCITNKRDSSIWNNADFKVDCCAGEEKSIAATKSLSTQFLICALIVLKVASQNGIDIKFHLDSLRELPTYIKQVYDMRDDIKEVAKFISKYKNIAVTGDGISHSLAKEASLKIKETSYTNVYSNLLGEFMHGHVAVLNNKVAMIHIAIKELSYTAIKNLNEIEKDYNAPLCIIGCTNEKVNYKYNLDVKCENEIVKALSLLVIIQILALENAIQLGRDVDTPHGLHKVVK